MTANLVPKLVHESFESRKVGQAHYLPPGFLCQPARGWIGEEIF